jgi:hypothetical protein
MNSMAFRRVDRLFIVVYGTTEPRNDDFSTFLESVYRNRFGILGIKILVATEGGELSEDQRRRFRVITRGSPVAVLSADRQHRALVNIQRWFSVDTRAFKMSEVDAALDYLKIPTQHYGHIKAELQEAFREVRGVS